MFFRNDDPGPLSEAEIHAMHRVLHQFNTTDEVRLGEEVRFLAPVLNTLTQTRKKFYLVHLPNGAGWVLRRHRPTGVYLGNAIPADDVGPAAPGPTPADHARTGDRPPQHEAGDRCFAEEYFGDRGPAQPQHAPADAAPEAADGDPGNGGGEQPPHPADA